jgi:RNA polymerase sigma factor (sigma-70 family)
MQEELYRRFSPRMYGVCLRYAGKVEEAEDILQEGFIKVYKKLNSYRGEGSFEGWIRRIFVNTSHRALQAEDLPAAHHRTARKIQSKGKVYQYWMSWVKRTL